MAEKDETIGWAILELMGHRRLAGYVRPVEVAGKGFLRIDVPGPGAKDEAGPWSVTQFYAPDAVYCVTPTTAETAIRAAGIGTPAPVSRWELPAAPDPQPAPDPRTPAARSYYDSDDDDDPDDDSNREF